MITRTIKVNYFVVEVFNRIEKELNTERIEIVGDYDNNTLLKLANIEAKENFESPEHVIVSVEYTNNENHVIELSEEYFYLWGREKN